MMSQQRKLKLQDATFHRIPSPKCHHPKIQTTMTQNGVAFPRFDVVSDHSDHAYAAISSKKQQTYDGSVHKTIMKEWRILENNLPDSIYVRVYDTRIELLRAVIVGAEGTPYHDALFFFDIKFPPDYPNRPPSVHYCSYGLRVNPNLYSSGYVCLSLLNTWVGKKREEWDPGQSTILQVLLSIQALVLNEKPYFNEPSTGSPGVEKRSRAYNEDVFVLTCKTTVFSLRNPPKNFEAFTAAHYREKGSRILSACGAYVNGRVGVGNYGDGDGDGDGAELGLELELGPLGRSTRKKPRAVWDVSNKFKASMVEVYPQLVQDFKRNGSVELIEVLEVESKTTPVKVEVKTKAVKVGVDKKAKVGIVKKVIGKLSKFLGLSKKKNQNAEKCDDKKDVNAARVVVGC